MRLDRLLAVLIVVLALAGCATSGANREQPMTPADRVNAAKIHTELAQHYLEQGHLKAALEKLQTALSFDEDYAPAHTVLGVLYERIGDKENAELHKRRAVELLPKDGATNNNYAVFLCQKGEFATAMTYFKRAVADPFYSTPSVAMANAASCMVKAGNDKQADAYYRNALKTDPQNTVAMLQLATLLYNDNDAFHARAFLQRYESAAKPTALSLRLGYDIETRLGNADGAQDYARRLRKGFPDSDQAHALDATPGS